MANDELKRGPVVLCILDGWGLAPTWRGNAIGFANPLGFNRLWRQYPHTVLSTYDEHSHWVDARLIQSELQHATLGAGRWILSDVQEITQAVAGGTFDKNPILIDVYRAANQKNAPVHLIGLASNNSVDSDITHLAGLLRMARNYQIENVPIHLIVEDDPSNPRAAENSVARVEQLLIREGIGWIASVVGRDLALNTTSQWNQTLRAYQLWIQGQGTPVHDLTASMRDFASRGWTARSLPPIQVLHPKYRGEITDQAAVIVWHSQGRDLNQLIRAFTDSSVLRPFVRRQAPVRKLLKFVSLVKPGVVVKDSNLEVAFPPAIIPTTLTEILAGRGLRQLRVGSIDKEEAVTTFFSGGRLSPYPGEDRLLVGDKKSLARGQTPANLDDLFTQLVRRLGRTHYDFVLVNVGQVDQAAHTQDLFATAAAVRSVDQFLERLAQAILAMRGTLLVTSDHGNAESLNQGSASSPMHTVNPVPLLFIAPDAERNLMQQAITLPTSLVATLARPQAGLPDVAPTILSLYDIPTPVEMTGQSLLSKLQSK